MAADTPAENAATTAAPARAACAPVPVASATARRGFEAGDLWAGLTAAAVVLPQAMAFGVALFSQMDNGAATGALAGLIGTACLCLSSGLVGRTAGLISAPTGPSLVLLAGALAAATAAGAAPQALPTVLVALTLVTGLAQLLLGAAGGGRLIKFIPYPVVAGFMTGAGILMMLSQVKPLSGAGAGTAWHGMLWLPALTAAVTFAITWGLPRLLPAVPGSVAGLVGGTLFFHALGAFGPGAVPRTWVIGALPGPGSVALRFAPAGFGALPWTSIALSALALALLTSINTLLAAVIADVATGARHDSRRELIGQGLGQIATGLLGGMTGSATTGATVLASRIGGRRWCSTVTGLAFVALIFVGGPVGTVLPVSVLAGIILRVALGTLERDIIAWARRRRTRLDAAVAVLVTVVTVAWNLMAAVGVGVAIAIVLFVRAQVRAPVVHRRSTATQVRSVRARSAEQRALLDTHGERIVLYELRGNLFFATAERLFEELLPDLGRPIWLILHMRRVTQVDLTGIKLLQQMAARVDAAGGHLLFCEVHRGAGLGHKVRKTLHKISPEGARYPVLTFNGTDDALEYAEDALLEELGAASAPSHLAVPLAQMDVCRDMPPEEVAAFARALRTIRLTTGERLFAAGDAGEELYLVARGDVDVRLPTTEHHYKRLARYGPGSLFGEVAFVEPGPRTADAIALGECELLALDRSDFTALTREHAGAAISLLLAIGKTQGAALRWSAKELRRLSEW